MLTDIKGHDMRFIINGRTFDTTNSTTVATWRGVRTQANVQYEIGDVQYEIGADEIRWDDVLYRTAKGAFFVHSHKSKKIGKGRRIFIDEAQELTAEEAVGSQLNAAAGDDLSARGARYSGRRSARERS